MPLPENFLLTDKLQSTYARGFMTAIQMELIN